jgi:hypothetical protein
MARPVDGITKLALVALTAGLAFLAFCLPATAVPRTLACALLSTNAPSHPFTQVDQFVYDLAEQSASLRVANTVETSVPVTWTFQTKKTSLDDDVFILKVTGQGVVGAGIYGSAPHSFQLSPDLLLTWSFVWFSPDPFFMTWQCRE